MIFLVFCIVCITLIIIFILDLKYQQYKAKKNRWKEVLASGLEKIDDNINLTLNTNEKDIVLKIKIRKYISEDFKNIEKLPIMLILQRNDRDFINLEHYGATYAFMGYRSVLVGYDKIPKDRDLFIEGLINAFPRIIEILSMEETLDINKICIIGEQYGAVAGLKIIDKFSKNYNILGIVAMSMPSIKLEEIENLAELKNKIFLIHAKNDEKINIDEFYTNIKNLNVPQNLKLEILSGGHYLLWQEGLIFGKTHVWLNELAKPSFPRIYPKETEI